MKTLVHVNPLTEFRSLDEVMERFFGRTPAISANATILPIDVFEKDGKFVVRASVPGVKPEDLDVQIENNVLTIRGETKSTFENTDVKVYRREISYGSFARSIRLPENLNLDQVDAEFTNGNVTISIPRAEEEKPLARKVEIRTTQEPQS